MERKNAHITLKQVRECAQWCKRQDSNKREIRETRTKRFLSGTERVDVQVIEVSSTGDSHKVWYHAVVDFDRSTKR